MLNFLPNFVLQLPYLAINFSYSVCHMCHSGMCNGFLELFGDDPAFDERVSAIINKLQREEEERRKKEKAKQAAEIEVIPCLFLNLRLTIAGACPEHVARTHGELGRSSA